MGSRAPPLPIELILHIVSLVPKRPDSILAPDSAETKTLVALTLVCHAIYPAASRCLRKHSVYVSSDLRLRDLLICIEYSISGRLGHLTDLYLAPFGQSLDDLPTAIWVRELFCIASNTLKRLVIDMPLRSLWPAADHLNVRATLRDGFARLTQLEEFVSVRDELFLRLFEPDLQIEEAVVWTLWPRLRRLALYNVDTAAGFWAMVSNMAQLEKVVLTRADGLEAVCAKTEYFETAEKPINVVLVNIPDNQPRSMPCTSWSHIDPLNSMNITLYNLPRCCEPGDDIVTHCQDYVRAAALAGNLWDWEGCAI